MEILPFGLFRDEGKERPTGGLVDAPSSKAVEEAGHFERIVRLRMAVGKENKPFETQRGRAATKTKHLTTEARRKLKKSKSKTSTQRTQNNFGRMRRVECDDQKFFANWLECDC